jgi:hypothetical protein
MPHLLFSGNLPAGAWPPPQLVNLYADPLVNYHASGHIMLLGHRSKNPPLNRFGDRREFTMAYLLCQIANFTVHNPWLPRQLVNLCADPLVNYHAAGHHPVQRRFASSSGCLKPGLLAGLAGIYTRHYETDRGLKAGEKNTRYASS